MDDDQGNKEEPYEFEEGQECVSRIIHMIYHNSSADIYYDLLLRFKKVFGQGGITRQKYTYPALAYSLIRLTVFINYPPEAPVEEVKEEPEEGEEPEPAPKVQVTQAKIFKNLTEIISTLQGSYPEQALRLNL